MATIIELAQARLEAKRKATENLTPLMGSLGAALEEIVNRCEERMREKGWPDIVGDPKTAAVEPERLENWQRSGIPKAYRFATFDTFEGNNLLVQAVHGCRSSMVLFGKTGCGKTHLACSYLQAHGGRFVNVLELLLKIRDTFRDSSQVTESQLIAQYSSVPVLVLDDLGSEKSSEYSITILYLIIDRRIREEKQTIITTNLSVPEIEKHMSARIASRLAGMQNFNINMPDRRKLRP